jgi:hypothetical protein
MPNDHDDYGRNDDTPAKHLSNEERRALHGRVSEDAGFKLEEVAYGKLLIGTITSGEFEGQRLSIRVEPAVIKEILSRPEVAPYVEGYKDVPVRGAEIKGEFVPYAQPENGKELVAIARERVAPQDSSKTVNQALQDLPEMNISQMRLDMSIIPGMKLERGKLTADLTGEIGFKGATAEPPTQKLADTGPAAKASAMKLR